MKKYALLVFCIFFSTALISCGGGGGGGSSAPSGSTITVSPGSFTLTTTNESEVVVNDTLLITVADSTGQPLGDREVKVTYAITAVPTNSSDLPVVSLNGSFAATEASCDTDVFGGCKVPVGFKTKVGLNYAGNINVRSGTNVTSVPFTVGG